MGVWAVSFYRRHSTPPSRPHQVDDDDDDDDDDGDYFGVAVGAQLHRPTSTTRVSSVLERTSRSGGWNGFVCGTRSLVVKPNKKKEAKKGVNRATNEAF